MRCYLDSSALLKRAYTEPERAELVAFLSIMASQGATFLTSALSRVETKRSLRRAAANGQADAERFEADYEAALKDIDIVALSQQVLDEAETIGDDSLRSLDAIHVATARLAGADMVVTYDNRMIRACFDAGVMTARPGIKEESLSPSWEWVTGDDPADVPEELWPAGW